jgi:hypothetical protein
MASRPQPGGAQALPIARAFLATGGALLITPEGALVTGGSLARIFGADANPREARRGFTIGRRLHRRLRDPRFAASLKCLVIQQGERTPQGGLVLEGY